MQIGLFAVELLDHRILTSQISCPVGGCCLSQDRDWPRNGAAVHPIVPPRISQLQTAVGLYQNDRDTHKLEGYRCIGLSQYDHQTTLEVGKRCRALFPFLCTIALFPQIQRLGGRTDGINDRYWFYRDGLERITVDAAGTVGTLRQQISSDLSMPRDNVTLSKDQKLVSICIRYKQHTTDVGIKPGLKLQLQLLSKTPEQFKDLSNNKLRLKQAGVQHGDMVSCRSTALPADVPHPLLQSLLPPPTANLCALLQQRSRITVPRADLHAIPF